MIDFYSRKFRRYEREIIQILLDSLSSLTREKLEKQISTINRIQRANEDEVNFYRMKWGRPTFDESLKLELKSEEFKVASLRFKNSVSELKVDIWIINGFLFSLEFSSFPKSFFNEKYEIIEKLIFSRDD
ncbi:MAG: hypothetical protein ED557_13390 [Balneola sp.]|nr:MAG: hypothetical protein ED557_13390 [Balneola sp.]